MPFKSYSTLKIKDVSLQFNETYKYKMNPMEDTDVYYLAMSIRSKKMRPQQLRIY